MRALLAKETREVGLPALVYFALATAFWFAFFDFEDVLIAPETGPHMLVTLIAGSFGLLLGYGIFASERWRGTEGFLLHRGGGSDSIFLAKVLVGLAATLLLSAGPPLIYTLWQAWASPLAPILQEARVIDLMLGGTLGVSVFAVGVLAAQLRRSGFTDVGFAILSAIGVAIFGGITFWNSSLPPVGVHLLIAAILLPVAWWMFRTPRDAHLSLAPGAHVVLVILALPLAVFPAYILLATLRGLASTLLLFSYPRIVHDTDADDTFPASAGELYLRLDPSGHPIAQIDAYEVLEPGRRYIQLFEPGNRSRGIDEGRWDRNNLSNGPTPLGWSLVERSVNKSGSLRFAAEVFFDEHAGVLHAFYYGTADRNVARLWPDNPPPPVLPAHIVVRRPVGRFSPQTVWPGLSAPSLLIDLQDRTLWEIDVTRPSNMLEQVELPGGDRFVGLELVLDRRHARFGLRGSGFFSTAQVLRGELDVYSWEGEKRFVPYRSYHEWQALSGDLPSLQDRELRLAPHDPIAMGIEVVDMGTGEVVFAHLYRPSTVLQRLAAGVIQLSACIGSPLVNPTSFFLVEKAREGPGPRVIQTDQEPLLVGGRRPGLLAAHLVLITVLAAALLRRQRRTGVGAANQVLSVALILIAGVPAFLVLRSLCGRARAPARRPDEAVRVPELLIRTA